MRFLSSLVLAGLFCADLLHAPPAVAQPRSKPAAERPDRSDKSEAARLKKDADALMDQDKYVDALALYGRAYELSSDPALLYNQGRALEAMGEYVEALDKLERFDKEANPSLRSKVPGLKDLLAELRSRIATVVVTTNAPGARLLVRDKAAGTIQKELRVRVRSGAATIEVVADGYGSFKKEIELAGGSVVKVDAQLSAKKSDAVVNVKTQPSADITIDGKAIGRSPLEYRLTPGQHVLLAAATGYETDKVTMTLALGDRRDLDLELKKSGGVLSKWWFWTAVGVVVAGGVATALALTIEKSPTQGNFGDPRFNGIVPGP